MPRMEWDKSFSVNRIVLNADIMKTLMEWLQDHILNEDKKYSQFAESK